MANSATMPSHGESGDLDLSSPGAVGQPIDRVDGVAKVTGRARYAAEAPMQDPAHALIVQSTIARGTIRSIDESAARAAPGVLEIITSENMPKLKQSAVHMMAENRYPLSDNIIHYAGQHIAVVVADTLEQAQYASSLLKVAYDAAPDPRLELGDPTAVTEMPGKYFGEEPLQYHRGDVKAALADPSFKRIDATYLLPVETHNPMELSATVAAWNGPDKLTVWDATQGVVNRRNSIAAAFGLQQADVRVLCPFVGGGFGCKGDQWMHTLLAVAAAKLVNRPVRLMLTRAQMFTSCGHRPMLRQTLSLAANKDGGLAAIQHDTTMQDSDVGHHIEACGLASSYVMYDTETFAMSHTVKRLNIASSTFMRAPGENPGTFALECALDELAYELGMDPLQLRLANYARKHPEKGLPFSTLHLKECYEMGAEKFGWSKRNPAVGSMKTPDGRPLGWGMATATYPGRRFPNQARIRLSVDSSGQLRAVGACATQDLGTGAYTVFTQITASLVGLPADRVKFELGDTSLPPGGVSGGSATTAGVGQALSEAADKLIGSLLELAGSQSPLAGVQPSRIVLRDGKMMVDGDASRFEAIAPLLQRAGRAWVEGVSAKNPAGADNLPAKEKRMVFQSFGVHFVEVAIDQPVPMARVLRVVTVIDVGRVVNPKTAHSQLIGGVVMGIGQALMEHTAYDPRSGIPVNANLADYPVCVNPDIHTIETYFVDKPDPDFNAIGCRGVGEIGITGIAAAVANAIYHATGKRVRELPITPDKLL